jgi:hypothetical protein
MEFEYEQGRKLLRRCRWPWALISAHAMAKPLEDMKGYELIEPSALLLYHRYEGIGRRIG